MGGWYGVMFVGRSRWLLGRRILLMWLGGRGCDYGEVWLYRA